MNGRVRARLRRHTGHRDHRTHRSHPETGAVSGSGRGWFEPERVRVASRRVGLDGVWSAVLVVTGYPREVSGAGWLTPLTGHPGLVDVSVHVTPVDPMTAASRLRRRLARLESGRRSDSTHGRLPDPDVDAAAEDAQLLADRVARGETKLFTTTVTVTVTAAGEAALDDELAAVRALLASLLMTAHPVSWRAWHGWLTGLPLGIDHVGTGRVLDTAALAAAFPFSSPDLPLPDTRDTDTRDPDIRGSDTGHAGRDRGRTPVDQSVLYGYNLASSSLVFWDRWSADNYNSVVLGRSGAGKSYLVKLELLRSLYTGVHAQVIDPEDEYVRLARAVGATVVRLGAPGVRINPLELDVHIHPDGTRTAAPDALDRRRLALHSFLALALTTGTGGGSGVDTGGGASSDRSGELSASERAVLDEAITRTYTRAGITEDPATWTRPAPLLADLYAALITPLSERTTPSTTPPVIPPAPPDMPVSPAMVPGRITRALDPDAATRPDAAVQTTEQEAHDAGAPEPDDPERDTPEQDPVGHEPAPSTPPDSSQRSPESVSVSVSVDLGRRLRPYVDGAFSQMFNGPSSHPGSGQPLTVWSLKELPEPLRPLATMLVLDAIWRTVTHPHDRRRRMVVVDEAWLLLAHPAGARFLLRAAKAGRKHWCGLVLATQDTTDVLSSDLGRAVITNSATQILLRQAPQAIERIGQVFGLSAGERAFLLSAERGDGLLTAGEHRCAFAALASAAEDDLITTDPAQLAGLAEHGTASPEWVTLDPPAPPPPTRPPHRGPARPRSVHDGPAPAESGWVW